MLAKNHSKRYTYHKRKAQGAAAIEFALVLIPLLMIVTGIIEFGRTLWYYDALTKATRDGARYLSNVTVASIGSSAYATTTGNCSTDSLTADRIVYCAAVAANVSGFSLSDVVVSCDGSNCVNNLKPLYVSVSINKYPVTIGGWIPVFLPTGTTTWTAKLSPRTTMRYMH